MNGQIKEVKHQVNMMKQCFNDMVYDLAQEVQIQILSQAAQTRVLYVLLNQKLCQSTTISAPLCLPMVHRCNKTS